MELPFKSTVSDLINYDFLDPPSWRNQEESIPSADEMISQIIDLQMSWNTLETKIEAQRLEEIRERFREKYCDINTDPLKDESEPKREKKEQESRNLRTLLQFFDNILEEEKEQRRDGLSENQLNCGLIERSMVKVAHEIAVRGIMIANDCTKPGKFSSKPRYTTHHSFQGKYYYPKPDDMGKEVDLILDRFNSLFIDSTCKTDKRENLKGLFKSLAWFLFEILDLHPFGNGNGRLFRSFCYYVLSSRGHTIFPCSLYHVCDEREKHDHSACRKPCKDNYELVLIHTRQSAHRHPQGLATMLVESCWRTWTEFMKEIQKCIPEK